MVKKYTKEFLNNSINKFFVIVTALSNGCNVYNHHKMTIKINVEMDKPTVYVLHVFTGQYATYHDNLNVTDFKAKAKNYKINSIHYLHAYKSYSLFINSYYPRISRCFLLYG